MVAVPVHKTVTVLPAMLILVEVELKLTGNPEEAVAESVNGGTP